MKKYFLNVLPLLVAGVMLAACANGTSYNLINDSFTTTTLSVSIEDISFEGNSGVSYDAVSQGVESPSTYVVKFSVSSEDLVLYTGSISGRIGAHTYELACSEFEGSSDEIVLISGSSGLQLTNLQASHSAGTITYSFTIPVSDGDAHMRVELSNP